MKTQGEIEAVISEGISSFDQDCHSLGARELSPVSKKTRPLEAGRPENQRTGSGAQNTVEINIFVARALPWGGN